MALDNVQSAVLDAAKREASLIVQKAQHAASERVARATEALRVETNHEFERQSRQIQEGLDRQRLQLESDARKGLLERQNALLTKVFERAGELFLAWPRDQYAAVMQRLLLSAAGSRGGKVRIHPEDAPVFEEILKAFNESRAENGRIHIAADQPLAARGGFVFLSGSFEVDHSLRMLLDTLRREEGPRVAAALFDAHRGG